MLHMDCNKDEAIRAKEIAEKKMQNDDFEGARKTAQRAQQLFPELENISQLLTVCNIHCSARNKICGSEMDWYGILRVDRLADDVTIKKQYRKLALLLHPDKNKFPGAEAAFKLIGEANMVLSDEVKRSLYDNKCKFSMRTAQTKPPFHQSNWNPSDRKQYVPAHLSSSNGRPAFWTTCPFCHMKYQYHREFVNQSLRCQKCLKPFIAYDLCAQGLPPRSNYFQPAFPQNQGSSFTVGSQSTGGFPPSHMGSQGTGRTVQSEPGSRTGSTAKVGGTKDREYQGANKEGGNEGVRSAKADSAKTWESGTTRNKSRKRSKKLVVESSESCDTSNSVEAEDVVIQEDGDSSAGQNCGFNDVHHPRRSFRRRHRVSYEEGLSDDDDFVGPAKRSKGNGLSGDDKEEPEEKAVNNGVSNTDNSTGYAGAIDRDKEDIKQKANAHLEGYVPNRSGAVKVGIDGEAVKADCNAKTSEAFDDSESDPDSGCSLDPDYYECPDPEFYDFDKDKQESCFAVDQIWACYDTTDGMPRFYARVRKVRSPGFRVQITWLEPCPEDQGAINWFNGDLPIACGKFVLGNAEEATGPTFSHQVHCEKISRSSYKIYPRKGEIWALFKGWNISWSSDPENHRNYNFEIVEVISDFVKDFGIKVGYLDKVEGFVSVFQRTTREGIVSFLIPPSEFLRFSHQVPSFKLIGTEREGIPEGSFELDPASLPCNNGECKNVKTEADNVDSKATGSNPRSSGIEVKSVENAENSNTPNKNVGLEGKNYIEKEIFKLRRSPRELNHKDKKHQMNASQCPTQEGTVKDLNGSKDKKYGDFTPPQGGEKIILPTKVGSPQGSATKASMPQSFHPGSKILEEFHDFSENKSEGKFLPFQIWAMYNEDGLPKNYGQIKKVEPFPFRLHVVMLEACIQSKDKAQASCCGAFRLQTGKARVFSPSAFSHEVKSKPSSKNKFEIYPREGQIWALYKDWNSDMSCLDLKKSNYEIVEVLEENGHYTKVSLLFRLNGFKSVFRVPRRQRSCSGVMEIPRVELSRFSHQIPSFNLRKEKDGCLRGCWELDPAAIPGNVLSFN